MQIFPHFGRGLGHVTANILAYDLQYIQNSLRS